jgi:2-dehydropantoate 2-reductase
MLRMRIAVVGAGAIGSVIGGLLSNAKEDVTLIGRRSHVEAINKNGLIIDSVNGPLQVKVKAAEHLDFRPELVLLTVKTQDVEEAAREIRPLVSGVPIVTIQNGIQSDNIVSSIFGKENILSCVIMFNVIFLESGKVTISAFSGVSNNVSILIGSPYGLGGKKLEDITALLNKAIPTRTTNNIASAHCTKLLLNLNNSIQVVTGLSIQDIYNYPSVRIFSIKLMREGLQALKSAGMEIASIPGLPLSLIKLIAKMPLPIASKILKRQTKTTGSVPVQSSTLQSIKRGVKTEIDYLNGEIVRLGKQSGMKTPYNSFIVDLVHQVESTGKFLTIEELSQRLRQIEV